jgi:hypothetical protein
MAGLTEFYCGLNEPSQASQFKWLEYTFNRLGLLNVSHTYTTFNINNETCFPMFMCPGASFK